MFRKITEVVIETSRVYIFNGAGRPARVWCARCAAEVYAVTPEVAAALDANDSTAPPGPESGDVAHCTEPRAGEPPLVCLNSLSVETLGQEGPRTFPVHSPTPDSY